MPVHESEKITCNKEGGGVQFSFATATNLMFKTEFSLLTHRCEYMEEGVDDERVVFQTGRGERDRGRTKDRTM